MKSQGEIEAAICAGITRFEQDYMGRGPKSIHAHLLGDLLVVRLEGVLAAAEQHLVQTLAAEKGTRSAQAGAHAFDRDGPSDHGKDGSGGHRHASAGYASAACRLSKMRYCQFLAVDG